jgi:hypothetical protein
MGWRTDGGLLPAVNERLASLVILAERSGQALVRTRARAALEKSGFERRKPA